MIGFIGGPRAVRARRRSAALAGAMAMASGLAAAGCGNSSSGANTQAAGGGGGTEGGGYSIVLSNAYLGNAWRKTMVQNFTEAAKADQQQGLIKDFKILQTQDNKATDQIAQLQTQILKKPDAMIIDAASPTALNPVIAKACAAGIKVIVFDALASAPCAYKINHDLVQYGSQQAEFIAQQLHGEGKVIEVRGVSGSQPDVQIHQGIQQVLKRYPGIKVVATVDGEASQTTAQQAVRSALRSLPKVDAVLTQGGGDAFGVIQAFESAGKAVPPVVLGNGGNELQWWAKQQAAKGYKTISFGTMPGQSTIALAEAIALLQGKQVPKEILNLPLLRITGADLKAWTAATPVSAIASPVYSQEDGQGLIDAAIAHQPFPAPPTPAG